MRAFGSNVSNWSYRSFIIAKVEFSKPCCNNYAVECMACRQQMTTLFFCKLNQGACGLMHPRNCFQAMIPKCMA